MGYFPLSFQRALSKASPQVAPLSSVNLIKGKKVLFFYVARKL